MVGFRNMHPSPKKESLWLIYDLLFIIISIIFIICFNENININSNLNMHIKRYMWQLGAFFSSNCLAQEHIFPHIYIYISPFWKGLKMAQFGVILTSIVFGCPSKTWGSSATHRSRLFCHVFGNATSKWTKAATSTSVGCECFRK